MIAYIIHTFPLYSSTFIVDEIEIMREYGKKIVLFSVQKPGDNGYPSEYKQHYNETSYLFPISVPKIIYRHLVAFAKKPFLCVSTLFSIAVDKKLSAKNKLRTLFHFCEAIYIYPTLKRTNAKHIHAHFLSGSASIAYFINKLYGNTYSLTAHGTDIFVEKVLIKEKVESAVLTRVGTNYNKEYLYDEFQIQKTANIVAIPFGISIDEKYLNHSKKEKVVGEPFEILNVGRLVWQKGQDSLILAMAKLRDEGINCCLKIIGEGEERDHLGMLIRDNNLEDIVKLEGKKNSDEVTKYYSKADLFVLSSVSEGFGLVLLEAMRAGLPVVAPRINGIPEIVHDRHNGRLFDKGNIEDLVNVIRELICNRAERDQLSRNAQNSIRNYDNKVVVNRFSKELENSLNTQPQKSFLCHEVSQ